MTFDEEIFTLLKEFFKEEPEKVAIWLDTPNPMFGGTTPSNLILKGRADKVLKFIKTAKEESNWNGK